MSETYEGNGDYSHNDEESDFKRKAPASGDHDDSQHEHQTMNEKVKEYLSDCIREKNELKKSFPIAERLLDAEIEKIQSTGRIPTRDPKYVDIYREKPIRVSQKILVPVREHPKFNFVGKLLGPKGNSLRRLQEDTLCKMTVLGRNSMKDRAKEEELRNSMDPKYAHLKDDLHVEISTIAPPAEAHARIAYAMAELRKYLIPDANDVIRQEQLRELISENPNIVAEIEAKQSAYKKGPHSHSHKSGYGHSSSYRPPPPPGPTHPPQSGRSAVPPKTKILSILDRARSAMDENYSRHYEEPTAYEPQAYDSYSYSHAPPAPPSREYQYDAAEYEPQSDYRREYYPHSPSYAVNPAAAAAAAANSASNTNHRTHVNR